ncbi:MAG: beta-N-acetylhexosaminidase [Anaerolineae bacterium]|nr:beta-N-acetylhexosaminidase [Anaerolineae bacterium]
MTIAVIPQPRSLVVKEGQFVITTNTHIEAQSGAYAVAETLAAWLRTRTGLPIPIQTAETNGDNAIRLTLEADPTQFGSEGYKLQVSERQIQIQASEAAGLFYGAQTLKQLLPLTGMGQPSGILSLPSVEVEDSPRFAWRGFMLDVARHFFPVATIKKYLDVMAAYKFNRFHFHLTDDQGWRIEIKAYPKLTEVGSQRAGTQAVFTRKRLQDRGPDVPETDGQPYGGYYTQDQLREIVAYAQQRFITVVPEIEMPGHSVAALTSYPSLGCVGSGYQVRTTWGIAEDVLCAGKESTFQYVDAVLSEVVALFPSEYIHIGGDECPKVRWQECPHCQAVMRQEGLKDEHELQSYFIRRVEKILEAKGRRLIGWDEILEGGLAPKATVMSWRGAQGGIEAASAGHEVVMTPNTHCYFDYYQADDVEHEPLAQPISLPLEQVYRFDPVEGVPTDKQPHVLGGQANLWTEYIPTEAHLDYMAFPRLLALAEAVWTPSPRASYTEFMARLEVHLERLDRVGINFRKP